MSVCRSVTPCPRRPSSIHVQNAWVQTWDFVGKAVAPKAAESPAAIGFDVSSQDIWQTFECSGKINGGLVFAVKLPDDSRDY